MKKNVLLLSMMFLYGIIVYGQSTAADFTATDCQGNSHNLFSELNSGKVVVIDWVMPCGSCVSPSQAAYDAVLGYASSNPGKVVFYLAGDGSDDDCDLLNTWGDDNGLTNSARFSTLSGSLSYYGYEMPKIVVLGGGFNHTVYHNSSGGAIQTALSQAVAASGIEEGQPFVTGVNLFPNSVKSEAKLNYTLTGNNDVTIEITNIIGQNIKKNYYKNQSPGKHETLLDFESISNGIYFLRLGAGDKKHIVRFTVAH